MFRSASFTLTLNLAAVRLPVNGKLVLNLYQKVFFLNTEGIYKSTCHCGAVELELKLPNGLEELRRCNCSMCSRRGAVVASVPLKNLSIIRGQDKLSLYQFNTNTAKHYFCSICGIYTHHQRRSNPHLFGINVACIDGINPYELGEIPVLDGINHPKDKV